MSDVGSIRIFGLPFGLQREMWTSLGTQAANLRDASDRLSVALAHPSGPGPNVRADAQQRVCEIVLLIETMRTGGLL